MGLYKYFLVNDIAIGDDIVIDFEDYSELFTTNDDDCEYDIPWSVIDIIDSEKIIVKLTEDTKERIKNISEEFDSSKNYEIEVLINNIRCVIANNRIGKLIIKYDETNHKFFGYVNCIEVGHLALLEETIGSDENPSTIFWLNGIYCENNKRQGYATKLLMRAIEEYGIVLISSAITQQHKDNNDSSARELTDEGAKFINRMRTKGIVKENWMRNPFGD